MELGAADRVGLLDNLIVWVILIVKSLVGALRSVKVLRRKLQKTLFRDFVR